MVLEHSDGKADIMGRRVEGPPPDILASSYRYQAELLVPSSMAPTMGCFLSERRIYLQVQRSSWQRLGYSQGRGSVASSRIRSSATGHRFLAQPQGLARPLSLTHYFGEDSPHPSNS